MNFSCVVDVSLVFGLKVMFSLIRECFDNLLHVKDFSLTI